MFLNSMCYYFSMLNQELLLNSIPKSLWKFLQASLPHPLSPHFVPRVELRLLALRFQPHMLPLPEAEVSAPLVLDLTLQL